MPAGIVYWGSGYIFGTNYNDTLYGSNNYDDDIFGKDGDDYLFGRDGNDFVSGGDGNDVVYGGDGKDSLYGEDGNDIILGWAGNDYLVGGDGNDMLDGYSPFEVNASRSFEYDTLTGGADADTFVLGWSNTYYQDAYYQGYGYALITDFHFEEYDKLQLYGSIDDYDTFTGNWFGSSATDTAITYKGDLIGILQDVSGYQFIMALDVNFVG
ncbi:MAG: hypothetical protein QNJ47_21025 [Nostocaceae cyanobacterium]|nr:hypothetical protein [Nostocaceae cyanobacterium]